MSVFVSFPPNLQLRVFLEKPLSVGARGALGVAAQFVPLILQCVQLFFQDRRLLYVVLPLFRECGLLLAHFRLYGSCNKMNRISLKSQDGGVQHHITLITYLFWQAMLQSNVTQVM